MATRFKLGFLLKLVFRSLLPRSVPLLPPSPLQKNKILKSPLGHCTETVHPSTPLQEKAMGRARRPRGRRIAKGPLVLLNPPEPSSLFLSLPLKFQILAFAFGVGVVFSFQNMSLGLQ